MNTQWDEEYAARFKTLSPREVDVWEEILRNEIRNLGAGEIAAAVRLMGEEKRKGKHKYSPGVEDLKGAIIKNRWLTRVAGEGSGPARENCVFCDGTGWMPFGASVREHETFRGEKVISLGVRRHAAGWSFYTFGVPCRCTLGQSALKAYPEADRGKIGALTDRVLGWKKTLNDQSLYDDRRYAVDEG